MHLVKSNIPDFSKRLIKLLKENSSIQQKNLKLELGKKIRKVLEYVDAPKIQYIPFYQHKQVDVEIFKCAVCNDIKYKIIRKKYYKI